MRAATEALPSPPAGRWHRRAGKDASGAEAEGRAERPARCTSAESETERGSSLGDQLRAERERRGLRLEQASEATKIRRCYLEALERQDWDILPAGVFARGYLRSYGEYLGLDVERLLRAYAREREAPGADEPSRDGPEERDVARLVLERLAATRGGLARSRLGPGIGWRALAGLAATSVGAAGVWIALRLPDPGPGAPVAAVAPSFEEPARAAPAPPERTGPKDAARMGPPSGSGAAGRPLPEPEHPTPRGRREVPARTAATPTTRAVPPSPLEVSQFGIWTDAETDPLDGAADRFEEGTVVWFWTRVLGGRAGDRIRHVWFHEGRKVAVEKLDIGGPSWRAQSRRSLEAGSAGRWVVEARDAHGRVLARAGFTCAPAGRAPAVAEPGTLLAPP